MLRKTFITLILLSVSALAEQDWFRSYEEAQIQALKEDKNIMVMISRENCDACWYMENIVFEDKKVQALLRKNFVRVYLDTKGDTVPQKFIYIGTPTFYFTRADGVKIGHRVNGASNVRDFTKKVNQILEEVKE